MSSVVYLDPSINAVLLPEVHVVLYVGHAALPILTPKCCHKAAILMEISKFKPNTVIAAQLPPSVAQSTSFFISAHTSQHYVVLVLIIIHIPYFTAVLLVL